MRAVVKTQKEERLNEKGCWEGMEWIWKAKAWWIWWEVERVAWTRIHEEDGKCKSDQGLSSWF